MFWFITGVLTGIYCGKHMFTVNNSIDTMSVIYLEEKRQSYEYLMNYYKKILEARIPRGKKTE